MHVKSYTTTLRTGSTFGRVDISLHFATYSSDINPNYRTALATETLSEEVCHRPDRNLHIFTYIHVQPTAGIQDSDTKFPRPNANTLFSYRADYRRHLVTKMRTTPLPPTWMAVETPTAGNQGRHPSNVSNSTLADGSNASARAASPRLEYVNRVSGERIPHHPGTSFFVAAVEDERRSGRWQPRGDTGAASAPSPQGTTFCGNNGSSDKAASTNSGSIGSMTGSLSSPTPQEGDAVVANSSTSRGGQDQGQAAPPEFTSTR